MLLMDIIAVYCENHVTEIHCLGRMWCVFICLIQMVYILEQCALTDSPLDHTNSKYASRWTNILHRKKNVKEVTYKIHELGLYTGLSLQYCSISVAQMELRMSAKD
jgi:hypothetical protein